MTFTTWDAIQAASYMLDHDIDPDDSCVVEQFLRKHYPRASKQFIAVTEREAVKLRDRNRLYGLFEYFNEKVPAWPDDAKVSNDLASEIIEDVERELLHIFRQNVDNTEYQLLRSHVTAAARYAALLLIAQAAWRKLDDPMKADYQRAAEKGLV